MASVLSRLPGGKAKSSSAHSRLLVIGREWTRQFGEYLVQFQIGRGKRADVLLGFDRSRRLSLCQVGVNESTPSESMTLDMDLVIGLNGSSLAFEERVKVDGWFLTSASTVSDMPFRKDIHYVVVPARALAQTVLADAPDKPEGLDGEELVGPVLFGAALSVTPEYPKIAELSRVFSLFHQSPVPLLVKAAYEGYDWIQDRQMRGKSLMVGAKE